MTEILTESFCERCGTRYTFETVQQGGRPLGRLGTLGRGLKHFVVMPEASFDEAMAVARSEEEQRVTTAQLEAFHRAFNFCLSCRQYTCAECWNAVEGRCLSCAPMPFEETPIEVLEGTRASLALGAPVILGAPLTLGPPPAVPALAASPASAAAPDPATVAIATPDLPRPESAVAGPEASQHDMAQAEVAQAEVAQAEVALPEPTLPEPTVPEPTLPELAELPVEGAPEPEVDLELEPDSNVVTGATTASLEEPRMDIAPFPGFQPGRSLDDEIAAYDLRIAALAAMPPAEAPIEVHAVEVHALEPQAPAPIPHQPTTRRAARGALQHDPAASSEGAPPTAPTQAAAPGTCRTCGLSISASARFCRRCGMRQDA